MDEPRAVCAGDDGRQGGTSNPSGSINHRPSSIRCLGFKPARMGEHGRPILGDVFVQQDACLGMAQQPRQRSLPVNGRLRRSSPSYSIRSKA
jgi:hypothetical protein